MKILVLLLSISTSLFASFHQSPEPFRLEDGTTAMFVDFQHANFELTYDIKKKKALAVTHISFESFGRGYPIFDSVSTPLKVLLNGEDVGHGLTPVPGNVSIVRYVNNPIGPGLKSYSYSKPP